MQDTPDRLRLVFGASGYIGTNLVPHLANAGLLVRASSRNPEVLAARGWDGVELVRADALEPPSLDAALEDVDTAYYLVHSMAAGGDFPELDREAARNFGRAAQSAGVRRIVYLGGLMPDEPESRHLTSRAQTGDILRDSGVDVTELRAGMIIGPGSAAWEVIRDLVNYLPVMITPRWVLSRSTPIALQNLLVYLEKVPEIEATAGEVYDAGGAETLSYLDIMRAYGRLVDRHPRIISVPVLTPRLSSYWLRFVTSVPTNVARALIDGLSQDVVARDHRLRELVPQKLMDFTEAADAALEADRRHDVPARWIEGSIVCRNFRPEYAFYAKKAGAEIDTNVPAEALWRTILGIGPKGDYFYANWLWRLRRAADWLLGGPSFRRDRRDPESLRVGDAFDGWRVIGAEENRRLTLLMEMQSPGSGVLEFTIDDRGGRRHLAMQAYWHPAGVWGLLYWYAMLPFHVLLFRGTVRAIVARAVAERTTASR